MYDLIRQTIKLLARKLKKWVNWYTSPLNYNYTHADYEDLKNIKKSEKLKTPYSDKIFGNKSILWISDQDVE